MQVFSTEVKEKPLQDGKLSRMLKQQIDVLFSMELNIFDISRVSAFLSYSEIRRSEHGRPLI